MHIGENLQWASFRLQIETYNENRIAEIAIVNRIKIPQLKFSHILETILIVEFLYFYDFAFFNSSVEEKCMKMEKSEPVRVKIQLFYM